MYLDVYDELCIIEIATCNNSNFLIVFYNLYTKYPKCIFLLLTLVKKKLVILIYVSS